MPINKLNSIIYLTPAEAMALLHVKRDSFKVFLNIHHIEGRNPIHPGVKTNKSTILYRKDQLVEAVETSICKIY